MIPLLTSVFPQKNFFTKKLKQESPELYYNSRIFPRELRKNLEIIFAFVNYFYNLAVSNEKKLFYEEVDKVEDCRTKGELYGVKILGEEIDVNIIQSFTLLESQWGFDKEWAEALISALEDEVNLKSYDYLKDESAYIICFAGSISFMISSFLNLDAEIGNFLEKQALAWFASFMLLNIKNDLIRGRERFSKETLAKFGLESLREEEVLNKPKNFGLFVEEVLNRIAIWQFAAEKGYSSLDKKIRYGLQGVSLLFTKDLQKISKDPYILYENQELKNSHPAVFLKTVLLIIFT